MSAELLLEQAMAFVRRSFSRAEVKTCEEYGGEFSAAEIDFTSYNCPAIFITVLGWQPPPKDARMSGRHVKQYRLAAFVIFSHVERKQRLKGAMALAEKLGTVLRQWAPMTEPDNAALLATITGLDYEPKCENMYSRAFDAARQAMFLVTWYQCAKPDVPLGPDRPAVPYAQLPDLVEVEINDTVQAGQELDLSPPDNDADIAVEESVDFAVLAPPPPPPPPPPPYTQCDSSPVEAGRYWVPPFVAALEAQPVFSGIQPTLIDLAPQNLVASGVSHSSGRWCFEFELERIWAYGDREHVDALDITAERSWLYGGVVSCVDLSANLPVYRTIFAANGEGAAEVVSTFADHTGIGDLTGMTYSGPGTVRLGMEVNLSTGDWAFYTMGNVDIASGVSPAIVGIPMLAAVASVTGTPGFYHLQSLYLNAGELWVARSGAMPWNF